MIDGIDAPTRIFKCLVVMHPASQSVQPFVCLFTLDITVFNYFIKITREFCHTIADDNDLLPLKSHSHTILFCEWHLGESIWIRSMSINHCIYLAATASPSCKLLWYVYYVNRFYRYCMQRKYFHIYFEWVMWMQIIVQYNSECIFFQNCYNYSEPEREDDLF